MGLDYYAILDISRCSSSEEIKLAYRKLALRLHPERTQYPQHPNPRPKGTFNLSLPSLPETTYWEVVNEAYDVFSNPLLREAYDLYGEEGLKSGISAPNGYIQPYKYHGEPMKTYFEFFGSVSPYADLCDAITEPPKLYSVNEGVGVKNKNPSVEKIIYLELEEIFHGAIKLIEFSRYDFIDESKTETELKVVTISVKIPPGISEDSKIVYPEAGDRSATSIPGDIIFIFRSHPHKIFQRDSSNLTMNYSISLKEALTGFKMTIKTIDNRRLNFLITDVVNFDYTKCIPFEGLPNPGNVDLKGNLLVKFNVKYPDYIPKYLRLKLSDVLDEIDDTLKKNEIFCVNENLNKI